MNKETYSHGNHLIQWIADMRAQRCIGAKPVFAFVELAGRFLWEKKLMIHALLPSIKA